MSKQIKIQYHLPVPNEHASRIKYPFGRMKKPTKTEIASFSIKAGSKPKFKARNLYQSARNFCRINKLNWKFTYRIMGKGKSKTIRIWRIK